MLGNIKETRELTGDESEEQFSEQVDSAGVIEGYHCNICKHISKTIGGIKNHITRSHKSVRVNKEKDVCRKCAKNIHDEKLVGTCAQCGGKEHYRCTKTSKENEMEYKTGMLPFRCSLCCAPGLWDIAQKESEKEIHETAGEIDPSSLLQENETLKMKVLEYEDNEKEIIKEAQGISDDNTKLVQEVNVLSNEVQQLRHELNKLRGNNKSLAVENNKLKMSKDNKTELDNLRAKIKDTELTYQKAQEIAITVKKKMAMAIKDAENQVKAKNQEIRKLVRENEKLQSENLSYAAITANIRDKRRVNRANTWVGDVECEDGCYTEPLRQNGVDNELGNEYDEYQHGQCNRMDRTDNNNYHNSEEMPYHNQNSWRGRNDQDDGYAIEYEDEYNPDHENNEDIDTNNSYLEDTGHKSNGDKNHRLYCHFYNRKGCTRPNCEFLHDIAPPCRDYMNGRCNRRFCGFSHSKKQGHDNRNSQNFHPRRPIQPGEPTTRNHSTTKDHLMTRRPSTSISHPVVNRDPPLTRSQLPRNHSHQYQPPKPWTQAPQINPNKISSSFTSPRIPQFGKYQTLNRRAQDQRGMQQWEGSQYQQRKQNQRSAQAEY